MCNASEDTILSVSFKFVFQSIKNIYTEHNSRKKETFTNVPFVGI